MIKIVCNGQLVEQLTTEEYKERYDGMYDGVWCTSCTAFHPHGFTAQHCLVRASNHVPECFLRYVYKVCKSLTYIWTRVVDEDELVSLFRLAEENGKSYQAAISAIAHKVYELYPNYSDCVSAPRFTWNTVCKSFRFCLESATWTLDLIGDEVYINIGRYNSPAFYVRISINDDNPDSMKVVVYKSAHEDDLDILPYMPFLPSGLVQKIHEAFSLMNGGDDSEHAEVP